MWYNHTGGPGFQTACFGVCLLGRGNSLLCFFASDKPRRWLLLLQGCSLPLPGVTAVWHKPAPLLPQPEVLSHRSCSVYQSIQGWRTHLILPFALHFIFPLHTLCRAPGEIVWGELQFAWPSICWNQLKLCIHNQGEPQHRLLLLSKEWPWVEVAAFWGARFGLPTKGNWRNGVLLHFYCFPSLTSLWLGYLNRHRRERKRACIQTYQGLSN